MSTSFYELLPKMGQLHFRYYFYLLFILVIGFFPFFEATFIVMPSECTREMTILVKDMKDINEETIVSHMTKFENTLYRPCDSVLTVVGIPSYQFDIQLMSIDIYPAQNGRCVDYLKMFNGPRVDNANVLTPLDGLCGNSLPQKTYFKTSRHYFTVRFKIESQTREKFKGFTIKIRQHEWSSPVNSQFGGFNPGGWADGVTSLFQWTWNLQVNVPGGSLQRPGQDLEKSRKGIECIECASCALDDFDKDRDVYSVVSGCYVCAKQWDISYNSAQRMCYSQRSYLSLIHRIKDPTINLDDPVTSGKRLGCYLFSNPYGVKINYCFCDENQCNNSNTNSPFSLFLLLILTCIILLIFRL
ncbi:uncharacterized protein LOC115222183 [Argonauta hians]